MTEWKEVKEGSYNRHVMIAVEVDECDLCHKTLPVLLVDTSEMEYGVLQICQSCANEQFSSAGQSSPG